MIIYDKNRMTEPSVVGGKGVGLAKLAKYGCPVPDFFVITPETDLSDAAFREEFLRAAKNLRCDLFAVRSSAVDEDGAQRSFAGQYLTKTNVTYSELLDAVRQVAASAETSNAARYIRRFGSIPRGMAIIVQRQIISQRAGVLFTRSPDSAKEMLVEWAEGAGERVVGGVVTPQRKLLSEGDPERSDGAEGELIRLARMLEKREGRPLDLEWTYDGEKLYLLQMRPMTALGDPFPPLPARKWDFYVYRDFCILCHDVQRRAATPRVQERVFGFSVPIAEGLLINGREFYSGQNAAIAKKIWEKLDTGTFFAEFIAKIEAVGKRTRRLANRLKRLSFSDCDDRTLLRIFRRTMERYIESYVPLMLRPDDYFLSRLERLLSAEKDFADIITPIWEKTDYSMEKRAFLRAVIRGDAETYLQEFGWMKAPLGKKDAVMTVSEVQKRMAQTDIPRAKKTLRALSAVAAEKKARYFAYLAQIADPEEKRYTELLSRFIFLRTYTAGNSDRLFAYLRNLLWEIAARFRVAREDLLSMSYAEIVALFSGERLSAADFSKRRCGELILFHDGESEVFYGSTVTPLLRQLLPPVPSDRKLCGDIACAGEIRGTVRLVASFDEIDKVREGDIVVTSMTTPEIVSALEKAGGIITDEGGITCHAAILAREYGVPCLVGTGSATRTLSDGATVFLDCIHGYVLF